MSRTLSSVLLLAVILVVSSIYFVAAYHSHEHYHEVISRDAKNYEGPSYMIDHKVFAHFDPDQPGTQEQCSMGGEFRRKHKCVSVKHTHHDVCCWHSADNSVGLLPHSCCGVGWKEHNCEKIIDQLCLVFDGTHKANLAQGVEKMQQYQAEVAASKKVGADL